MYEIYTDGSCKGNGQKDDAIGCFGYIILKDNQIIHKQKNTVLFGATNNMMELYGVLEALRYVHNELNAAEQDFILYCDSAYVVNAWNDWMKNWSTNGWKTAKGDTIKNFDIIYMLYEIKRDWYPKLKLIHIDGHADNIGNELIDALVQGNNAKYERYERRLHG